MRALNGNDAEMLQCARQAAEKAYCPYSRFPVGAVVETDLGRFAGCNIENASYGLAICAERVAIASAIAAGARQFHRLAVSCVAAKASDPVGTRMPCGACRQVIAEFLPGSAEIIVDGAGAWSVAELLPQPFQLSGMPACDDMNGG